jgi:hypothetical protein
MEDTNHGKRPLLAGRASLLTIIVIVKMSNFQRR